MCNRKFRRLKHQAISTGDFEELPFATVEVMNPWDLGGDGKGYHHGEPTEKWFIKMMRK